jgi:hypothetical protein
MPLGEKMELIMVAAQVTPKQRALSVSKDNVFT